MNDVRWSIKELVQIMDFDIRINLIIPFISTINGICLFLWILIRGILMLI